MHKAFLSAFERFDSNRTQQLFPASATSRSRILVLCGSVNVTQQLLWSFGALFEDVTRDSLSSWKEGQASFVINAETGDTKGKAQKGG